MSRSTGLMLSRTVLDRIGSSRAGPVADARLAQAAARAAAAARTTTSQRRPYPGALLCRPARLLAGSMYATLTLVGACSSQRPVLMTSAGVSKV